ncbi:hypothetical protein SUGI_0431630 [Cryptomeria japonica]|uniref:peroxidase 21 n=1 Tax=Cryptomeria japonica TaxID=3369 RepID=UPI002408E545|nr:peroxidase 21 [Cryptomeria japonica]GLJ22893.1 hypothetical protein SUGI_0431630 [Cryptomeria japonica]
MKKFDLLWSSILACVFVGLCYCHEETGLSEDFYQTSCPQVGDIVKEQVHGLYEKHGNTAVSWLRLIFHDCMVESCDASILLDTHANILSEKGSDRNFGMRNFKYMENIKDVVEKECPGVVSCADIIVLAAREGILMLGGPPIAVKTGRRDSRESSAAVVEKYIPLHNDSLDIVLSRFESIGIDAEGTVALLGAHTVGRTHCVNLVGRLYPTVDPLMDSAYSVYLKKRCPTSNPDPKEVLYARNDQETPMLFDNFYYTNLIAKKGLLLIDQELLSDNRTSEYVSQMAQDNQYFFSQFEKAFITMSENNPLTGSLGEIRRNCQFSNPA